MAPIEWMLLPVPFPCMPGLPPAAPYATFIHVGGVLSDLIQLDGHNVSSIRRIVRSPERWERIVELAKQYGTNLPPEPSALALHDFMLERRVSDPDHFPDLSLAVVKLLGPGEYILDQPGIEEPGHFGLAVQDYTHSTAPNRRYADLVSQRIVKAVLANAPPPYTDDELQEIAERARGMAEQADSVHVAFNNNRGADAPTSARRFRELVGQDPGPPPQEAQLRAL